MSKLLNVYGARKTKKGTHLNITLITEDKAYLNTCVLLETNKTTEEQKKHATATIIGDFAIVRIPLLKTYEDERQVDKTEEAETEGDIPF